MLQVPFIREHQEATIRGLEKKQLKDARALVEELLQLDENRRKQQAARDQAQAEANQISKQIGKLMKEGKRDEAEEAKARTGELKARTKQLEQEVAELEAATVQLLYKLPNLPADRVPEGKSAADNEVVEQVGAAQKLGEEALPHWELLQKFGLADFELGNKVTGAGFPFFTGQGARLQRSLISFFLDQAAAAGYTEVVPPLLVNEASGLATGQLPDKEGQMYHVTEEDFYLIPTAEVPITNMYRDTIVDSSQLPIRHVGYSQCFRREAGSWGAHVRGLNRLHQFDKVEIVQIVQPEQSYDVLETMRQHAQQLLHKLELPYRVLLLCGGDISFNAALCYDLEVYSAAQDMWLEVSSVSNFETYQANRLKLRYRDAQNKPQLLHTLNGSALALPRIIAALLENNQASDHIRLPKVLHPYFGAEAITLPA